MTKKRGSHLSKGNRICTLRLSDIVHTCTLLTRSISGNPWRPKNTNLHSTKSKSDESGKFLGAEPTSAVEFRSTSPHIPGISVQGYPGCRDAGKEEERGGRLIFSIS